MSVGLEGRTMKLHSLRTVGLALVAMGLLSASAWANVIPFPRPASMQMEELRIVIERDVGGFQADFIGDMIFDYIPSDVTTMWFPLPPDATAIQVWQDDVELNWNWNREHYPTVLPEIPEIPMIQWEGPFPLDGAVFTVAYQHQLIARPDEDIFFYALGTGKYFPGLFWRTTAHIDIDFPEGFDVAGVWLDSIPVNYGLDEMPDFFFDLDGYEIADSHMKMRVQPWQNDLLVSLVPFAPNPDYDGNGELTIADVDLLGMAVAGASQDDKFDLTGDGNINSHDVDALLGLANRLNGDADFSGEVDFSDFLILTDSFEQPDKKWSEGDFDTNGHVQFADFLILANQFGQSAVGVATVPEPSSYWIVIVLALAHGSVWRHIRGGDHKRDVCPAE